jgi:hypothetical protein
MDARFLMEPQVISSILMPPERSDAAVHMAKLWSDSPKADVIVCEEASTPWRR